MVDIYKNTDITDLPNEIWKDILGYEGLYQVSNLGRIKSFILKTPRILKQYYGGNQQLMVTLSADGVKNKVYVSHIVGVMFVGVPNKNKKEIYCHLNKVKTDNRAENISIETKSNSKLLNYHYGVETDWGIKHVGKKTQFVSKYKYIGTNKKGEIKEYTYNELYEKYGQGVRSIERCIINEKNFNTAYGMTWEKELIKTK